MDYKELYNQNKSAYYYTLYDQKSYQEKYNYWATAIGLQDVDGLKPSSFLIDIANRSIKGELSLQEVKQKLSAYYEEKDKHNTNEKEKEADIVSTNITTILTSPDFSFSVDGLLSIHKYLFNEVFSFAGEIRTVDISKKEWVLNGESVLYSPAQMIIENIKYDLEEERKFSYTNLNQAELVSHLSLFIARLWQIHPFREGNTRTSVVFLIKYLNTLGYSVTNDLFSENSWFFRNALVRACYSDRRNGILPDFSFLETFFNCLLFNEKAELKNRNMKITSEKEQTGRPTDRLTLLEVLSDDELSARQIMNAMGLSHVPSFRKTHLKPALENGLIERTIPENPNHPAQKYRLTEKGKKKLSDSTS